MKKCLCLFVLALLAVGGAALAADGESLFKSACAGCHGGDASKPAGGSAPLKGQSAAALREKLKGYADGGHGGKQRHVMENVVKKHSRDDLERIADYISRL